MVVGDNQPWRGRKQPGVFRRIIDEINLLRPSFVMHVGDTISGYKSVPETERQFAQFQAVMSRLKMPWHMAIGNHDVSGDKARADLLRRLLGKERLYYSFTFGNAYFAVLDSDEPRNICRIAGEQFDWLEADLRKNERVTHKFIFVHRPFWPVDGHTGNCLDRFSEDRTKLVQLLRDYHVKTVFCGHEHLYDKLTERGITQYITGGAGGVLFPSMQGTGAFHHYLLVTVDGDDVNVLVIEPGGIKSEDCIIEELARKTRATSDQ